MTATPSDVDLREFDMKVYGLRTAQVGPSEKHEIHFNAYLFLKEQYEMAGDHVTEDVLRHEADHLKRDLQGLRSAPTKPSNGCNWWARILGKC